MTKLYSALLSFVALLVCPTTAFVIPTQNLQTSSSSQSSTSLDASRRDFMASALQISLMGAATSVVLAPPKEALASGGATAGGAYLLSAKQRYNERVKAGVRGFLKLKPRLESGDVDGLRAYFASEDEGGWKDLTSAGYLLANAFRRNSTTPPDSLPAVKAWKKFAASVESITKALKKKDNTAALAAYSDAMVNLNEYLKQVELPETNEIAIASS